MNKARLVSLIASFCLSGAITGCAVESPVIAQPSGLTATPDLSHYARFELYSQSAIASGQLQTQGKLLFKPEVSQFDIFLSPSASTVGSLHVQADSCRDDPSPDCQRRFVASGRFTALGATLNCTVPIRNDSTMGYAQQTLSGICQSQFGRAFTLHLLAQ